jgi:hypothetical protein
MTYVVAVVAYSIVASIVDGIRPSSEPSSQT